MKYTVIKRFKDKYTGEKHLPGDSFISDEAARIKDLLNRNLIKCEDVPDLSSLTKKQIQKILEERGIEYSEKLKKDDLISLLGGE